MEEHIVVVCPVAQAAARLKRFFREHGGADANTVLGSLPIHAGKQAVEDLDDHDSFWLRLSGGYTLPPRLVRAAFDAAVKRDFQKDEGTKNASTPEPEPA